jgi:hypothetical protein
MELTDVFETVADAPAPPSRLDGTDVFRRGRRRRRLMVTGQVAAVAIVVLLASVAVTWLPRSSGGTVATPFPSGSAAPSDSPMPPVPVAGVQWAAGADARHLYAVVTDCDDCPRRLLGSDDGGEHWTERVLPLKGLQPRILGPTTLLGYANLPVQTVSGDRMAKVVSTDGGRTWNAVTRRAEAVAAVPDGGSVVCQGGTPTTDCTLFAIDPRERWEAPLASQPGHALMGSAYELRGGVLAVTSIDKGSTRPTVSISTDRGRTWKTHEFTDLPVDPGTSLHTRIPSVTSRDGRTLYVLVSDNRRYQTEAYRSDDAGATWRRIDGSGSAPYALSAVVPSFVLPDGTHTLQVIENGRLHLWTAREAGERYAPINDPAGLAVPWEPIRMLDDGTFLSVTRQTLYRSTDGLVWSAVKAQVR